MCAAVVVGIVCNWLRFYAILVCKCECYSKHVYQDITHRGIFLSLRVFCVTTHSYPTMQWII